jgi:hypothetical protein
MVCLCTYGAISCADGTSDQRQIRLCLEINKHEICRQEYEPNCGQILQGMLHSWRTRKHRKQYHSNKCKKMKLTKRRK